MSTQRSRVWFITGSSSGLGRALTEAVLQHGETAVATACHPQQLATFVTQYPDQVLTLPLDVTDPDEIQTAISQAIATFKRIDVVVNNAGYGMMGAIEEISDADIRDQFETNYFGALNIIRAVLPHLRRQRFGHILNVSSLCGVVSFASGGIYASTKFALEGLSEALAQEVAPLGIKVTIVEPGGFRTNFIKRAFSREANSRIPAQLAADYASTSGETLEAVRQMEGRELGDPVKAAEAMIQVVNSDNPPLRLVLGEDAIAMIEGKLAAMQAELETWKPVGMNTAFPKSEDDFLKNLSR